MLPRTIFGLFLFSIFLLRLLEHFDRVNFTWYVISHEHLYAVDSPPIYNAQSFFLLLVNLPSYQMKSERHHNIFVRDTVLLG